MSIHYTLFNIHHTDEPNPKPYTTTSIIITKFGRPRSLNCSKITKEGVIEGSKPQGIEANCMSHLPSSSNQKKKTVLFPHNVPNLSTSDLLTVFKFNCGSLNHINIPHQLVMDLSLLGPGFDKIFKWLIKLHRVTNTQAPRVS